MYEVCLYFDSVEKLRIVETNIFELCNMLPWTRGGNRIVRKSMLQIPGMKPVGLMHSMRYHTEVPVYSLSMYRVHCERTLRMRIDKPHSDEPCSNRENWDLMNARHVKNFHVELFRIIDQVNTIAAIVSASINTEDRGMKLPYSTDGSICLSPMLPPILRVDCEPTICPYGFFVSIKSESIRKLLA